MAGEREARKDTASPAETQAASKEGLPWYRFFWVWFIVILLGTTISAALWTVRIAFENADSLVRDDWYADGTQINRRLEKEQAARRLGIRADLRVDAMTGEVSLELIGAGSEALESLRLELSHPTQASRDHVLLLERDSFGRFRGQLERRIAGRWYAILGPGGEGADAWRLTHTLQLPDEGTIVLGAGT